MIVREEKALYEFERKYAAMQDALLPYGEAARIPYMIIGGKRC